jgi:hypothetical protein
MILKVDLYFGVVWSLRHMMRTCISSTRATEVSGVITTTFVGAHYSKFVMYLLNRLAMKSKLRPSHF